MISQVDLGAGTLLLFEPLRKALAHALRHSYTIKASESARRLLERVIQRGAVAALHDVSVQALLCGTIE
jgi:hypothetical protein